VSGRTFAEKVLARAGRLEDAVAGEIVDARPDVYLSHDNSAAIRTIWRRFGQERLAHPERHAITLDHAAPAPTPRHALNHAEIRRFVAEQGIEHFFEVGDGICHQVLSEEAIVTPGQLVLGADSHTPHFGWMGAFGAGVGRSEMAAIWATGELWLRVPETLAVDFVGSLLPWVTAKDMALHMIGTLGADGGLYRSIELGGETVRALSLEGRMALANMTAEMGAKCSFIAPDRDVFETLARSSLRRRGEVIDAESIEVEIRRLEAGAVFPDEDATYEARHTIDVTGLRPQVSCPHSVENTVSVDDLGEVRVDQAFIGTCTNGRLEDLEEALRVLRGRRLARGTRLIVVPASRRVLEEAIERGWIADLVRSGAAIGTPGCGPCMGNHLGVLAEGEVCISSANRNFQGRMGERDAEIYLASPAVVAASAIAGRIVSPEEVAES
jgi:3-isopropylmalate/(R)-2-methylmalate dehydratase large subunit